MPRGKRGEASATLLFIRSFLRTLAVRGSDTICTTDMAALVNNTMNQTLRPERAVHLTGLIRRVSRDLGIVLESYKGKVLFFGPNESTLPPDIAEDAIIEMARKVLDAINKYQSSSTVRPKLAVSSNAPARKNNVQNYICQKDEDSFSVKIDDLMVTITKAGELFLVKKGGDRQGFIVAFMDKKKEEE